MPAPVISDQQATLQRRFARIVRLQKRVKLRVPLLRIIKSALLNPIFEIIRSYLIGNVEQRMLRFDESYWRILVRDALVTENTFVRRELRPFAALVGIRFVRLVIKNDPCRASDGVIRQLRMRRLS